MRFRQVHLDFHTSELIEGIGASFSAEQFQAMLKLGHVDSITVFSKCHHGWAYHPSTGNEMHPHLTFDLLGAQIEAAHAIGVKTPVYLSAGLDEKLARLHPEWLVRRADESTQWAPDFLTPGYHEFCMNTPYLDMLVAQIEEVVQKYDADGIFLDIVGIRKCYCQFCVRAARAEGIDPRDEAAMRPLRERTYFRYAERTNEAVHKHRPGLPVFHNGGHIPQGRRDLAFLNTHQLELESLPTGGWGYDHFPLSARYVQQLGRPFLGMTGKFHLSWGEFGGFKHPNALRYEAALSLANGAGCSVGDQLHPDGLMDVATYRLIGEAYREVEAKEAWCKDALNVADIAVLGVEASGRFEGASSRLAQADKGAVRMLLETHRPFDVVDTSSDWSKYAVLVLPDVIPADEVVAPKLEAFVRQGGKVLATGTSALRPDGSGFAVDFGARWTGPNPFCPDYFVPAAAFGPGEGAASVMYGEGQRIEVGGGTVLGYRENPYFNRDAFAFSSHRHTPNDKRSREYAMVEHDAGIYIGWNLFADYADNGSLSLRQIADYALSRLLPKPALRVSLPAQGVTTLQEQPGERRLIHHLLYASPVRRGKDVEIVEDLLPVYDVQCEVRTDRAIAGIRLVPQMTELPYEMRNGAVTYTVPVVECHQMVELRWA
ncbi:beta-galactosidase trimerization domain-containing protein [Cohnella ginsengisoli]|uniref:Beta-galactosidase trimerization domain-containing protein n=1 Tax=Cohnella ginsengisoli TaxID=425004 RepID=A0A9X4KIW7_9BACL|nr:alpha-amylase family protein [Cohnella ginsengisoli]MDG0792646.1 beta-galactosidase trimerization domain-containing protein [Cohnella ginsengisoli]